TSYDAYDFPAISLKIPCFVLKFPARPSREFWRNSLRSPNCRNHVGIRLNSWLICCSRGVERESCLLNPCRVGWRSWTARPRRSARFGKTTGPKGDPGPSLSFRVVTGTDNAHCADDENRFHWCAPERGLSAPVLRSKEACSGW